MSKVNSNHIRLTQNQRTWAFAYLQIAAPHNPDDLFCHMLVDLLSQPMADEPPQGQILHLVTKGAPEK
jgi:hypothetical protein